MERRELAFPGGRAILEPASEPGLIWLVYERPKGNVFTRAGMEALTQLLREPPPDDARLLGFHGAGEHFSFGAAVDEHVPEKAPAMLRALRELVLTIANYPVPAAALVSGKCLGGAFELALACHLVLAGTKAEMGCPEIRLGVLPPAFAVLGPMKLSAPLTNLMILTGKSISGAELADTGFVSGILEDGPTLRDAAAAWYRAHLAPLSGYSLRQALRACQLGGRSPGQLGDRLALAEHLYCESLLASHDGNEGIRAFMEKRQPVWRHH